ncbi:hypothetical protein BD410DRAFT_33941 [Rickenella mellea]|uniref:C2H2-type domain-containing protein n=1 Tax=Rickenella mellea TaxID=50990 RepID=A0A4R5XGV3_9AGAM|nr:hypothetical protein BD410DRAFT_33941 [Rickenella mellea]
MQKAAKATKELSLSCLRRRPCLWKDCGQTLNSSKTCITHLQEHVSGERRQDNEMSWISYPCNYDQCVRRFKDPDVLKTHLERHELRTLSCPYEGCEHVLHDTRELAYHGTLGHPSGKLRPTFIPKQPSSIAKPPAMPAVMPAYMAISTPVAAERMSKDRHARLGPWVLRNIFGPVNLDVPKHNARYPLRNSRRIGEKEARMEAKSHAGPPDEYDFLGSYATYPIACSDLENAYVSDKVDAGLVLWPGKPTTRKDTSPIRRVDTGTGTKPRPVTPTHSGHEAPSNDGTVGASLLEIPEVLESRGVGSDEEKAVEDLV